MKEREFIFFSAVFAAVFCCLKVPDYKYLRDGRQSFWLVLSELARGTREGDLSTGGLVSFSPLDSCVRVLEISSFTLKKLAPAT